MKGALKVGSFARIPLLVHWSMPLGIALIGGWVYAQFGDLGFASRVIVFLLALFGCVTLHEYGHALMARRFGVNTSSISLLIIGGLARLDRIPERPGQEILIALAGPAVNLAIALLLLVGVSPGLIGQTGPPLERAYASLAQWPFLWHLMLANLSLMLFNLLPVFPMDGGRVLRAVLAWRLTYLQATWIAARLGQALAVGLVIIGLGSLLQANPGDRLMLAVVGVFVFQIAAQELTFVRRRSLLRGARVRDAMNRGLISGQPLDLPPGDPPEVGEPIDADDSLNDALDRMIDQHRTTLPVIEGGQRVGRISLELLEAWVETRTPRPRRRPVRTG